MEYRALTFAASSVQIVSPSIEYYWKKYPVWAQSSWNQSWSRYKQLTGAAGDSAFAAQINDQVTRRVLLKAGFVSGAENFIDLDQIGGIREKSVFGGIECRITRRYTAGFSYGYTMRSNDLTQQTVGIKLVVRL